MTESQKRGHSLYFHSFLEFEVHVEKEMLGVLNDLGFQVVQEEVVFEILLNGSNDGLTLLEVAVKQQRFDEMHETVVGGDQLTFQNIGDLLEIEVLL